MKVWTNGCFDVLHRGHIELFRFCKLLAGSDGEVIVGIDSDKKVKKDKGKKIEDIVPLTEEQQLNILDEFFDE